MTTRKSLQCFSLVLEKLRRNFCPYFQGFCRDFRGFLPDIQQIIFLGDALALLAPPPPITLLCWNGQNYNYLPDDLSTDIHQENGQQKHIQVEGHIRLIQPTFATSGARKSKIYFNCTRLFRTNSHNERIKRNWKYNYKFNASDTRNKYDYLEEKGQHAIEQNRLNFPREEIQDQNIMRTFEKQTYKRIDIFKNRFERLLRFIKICCAFL